MSQAMTENIQTVQSSQTVDYTDQKRVVNSIAMIMILVSLSMLFATLFLGYTVYRVSADTWPPFGFETISLTIPGISTLLVLLSSFFLVLFKSSWLQEKKSSKYFYFTALAFGFGFLLSQFQLWASLKASGILAGSSVFASMVYAFTWIHAAHMVVGILALLWISTSLKGFSEEQLTKMINVEKFWHFLGVIWVIIFFGIFVF
ncbi:hypothetical protein OAT67_02020 [Bacteriovoracaceae bacterium]|nr:hypothetical protein [Bacteriovoracaceae bacterium]|tara:strand:+ start:33114 stop:33722 length:609 start_codon:yes stop_codon:yes gene_type:complete